jgi:hypothetical protein
MTIDNKLILVTIVCNLFTIVGIGHGAVPIGFVEPSILNEVISGESILTLTGGYSTRLPACVFLAMAGQIILLVACILNKPLKLYIIYSGLTILYFSLLFLSFNFSSGELDTFSFFFAIPFLYASIRLIVFLIKSRNKSATET